MSDPPGLSALHKINLIKSAIDLWRNGQILPDEAMLRIGRVLSATGAITSPLDQEEPRSDGMSTTPND
jgi:hypothetical protein